MNTRLASRWFWPALAAVFLTIPFFTNKVASQPQGEAANASVKTAGGLTVVTFSVKQGTITVNLPDDMRAGDTISGVVTPEPKGGAEDERNKNRDVLNGFVIEAGGANFRVSKGVVGPIVIPGGTVLGRPPGSTGNMPPMPPSFFDVFVEVQLGGKPIGRVKVPLLPSGAVITPDPKITPPGMTPSGAVITPDPKITTPPGMTPSGAVITPDPKITPTFIIPPLGQTGRPIVITGPFDGNSSNTQLNWTRPRSAAQDFEKNTENVSGGFGLIAESPRKAVFNTPTNVTGPIELHLKEGNKEATGNFRNVGINLTAPKTSLLKGESTELHVEVTGLQGLTQPVPLTLAFTGVITAEGGPSQPLVIQPSQVGPDGRFTTTRGITGVETGGWTATGTVVTHRFDFCLQDDSNPQTVIQWNSFTGDYIFTPSGGTSLSGQGTVTRKGCTITLTDSPPDRRVQSTIDPCTQTGSASVQTSPPKSPKIKFTITDRNTANNTCACGPGCK